MADLKLIALDADDLAVISAHLQDAVLQVGDIAYLPKDKRFAAITNRFDWFNALQDGKSEKAEFARRRTALRFERVLSAQVQGIHGVTANATDLAGNTSSNSSALSVTIDTAAPTISSPGNQSFDIVSTAGTIVNFTQATASDNFTPSPVVVHVPWRSLEQLAGKVRGGSAALAEDPDQDHGTHWRTLGRLDDDELKTIWERLLEGEGDERLAWSPKGPFRVERALQRTTWDG